MTDVLARQGNVLDVILQHGLAPLWHYRLEGAGLLPTLPATVVEPLHQFRVMATARYLAQQQALTEIDRLLESAGIAYAVMKGVHIRECVYPEPSLRLAGDIDVLVLPRDRQQAARLLRSAGFEARIDTTSISHEACFTRHAADVDLHWNLLRPGRTRIEVTPGFLERRQRRGHFWGLSDRDALFVMLTHPAFTKYICSPNMGLFRVADFLLWIQHRQVEWPDLVRLLDSAGLKTAAWTMLQWYRMLSAPDTAVRIEHWQDEVCPGRLRAAYLRRWLELDLPERWLQHPWLIQFGLTLFLHDHPSDARRALSGWWRSRRNRQRDLQLLMETGEVPDATP